MTTLPPMCHDHALQEHREASVANASSTSEQALSTGMIMLIVAAVCAVQGCCVAAVWFARRRSRQQHVAKTHNLSQDTSESKRGSNVSNSTVCCTSLHAFLQKYFADQMC